MTRFLKLVRHQNGSWQALPTETDEAVTIPLLDDEDAPIDPAHLLKALDPLLFDDGGIKESSATQFSSLMKKFSKKLVSRCVYVNVLKVTKPDVLEKLLDQGGWCTINSWLTDAKESNNQTFLVKLLQLCKLLPMTVERLKENNTPKIVKSLTKFESDDVKTMSNELITKWMTIIKGETNSVENNTKKKKKLKITKEHNKEQKDPKKPGKKDSPVKEKKEETKEEKIVAESPPKPLTRTRGSKRTSTEKSTPEEELNEDTKSDTKDEPLPKKSKIERLKRPSTEKNIVPIEEVNEDSKIEAKPELLSKKPKIERLKRPDKAIPPETFYEDVKIDIKPEPLLPKKSKLERPKTVKSFGAKFRATGLEEAAPLPKKISKKTPTVDKTTVAAVTKSAAVKRLNSTLPERITEKKIKPESLLNINETITPVGGIKLIPAKPRPAHILQESASFMDALVAQPVPLLIKRKKKPAPKSPVTPPTSPPIKPPKLQFYKDTLEEEESTNEESKAKKDENEKSEDKSPASPKNEESGENGTKDGEDKSGLSVTDTELSEENAMKTDAKKDEGEEEVKSEATSNEDDDDKQPLIPGQLRSILSHHGKRRKKKNVKWVEDENLKEMFYFELDETERVNVLRNRCFGDLKSMEAKREREAFELAKRQAGDRMEETIPWWSVPLFIDLPPPLLDPGCYSREKEVQRIRQQSVLQAIYFTRELIPDSPQEPDSEIVAPQEPKIIPLDEENAVGSVLDYSAHKMPPPNPTALPEVLSSLINISKSLPPPQLNHIDQMPSNPQMLMQQHVPASPTSPYDPGEPVLQVAPNMNIPQQLPQVMPQSLMQQPMFNAPRPMMDQENPMPMPMQNNWSPGMDPNMMPPNHYMPGMFSMPPPYPMMDPNIPPSGMPPHTGGGGMRRMRGGRMLGHMTKGAPPFLRPQGPRRGVPHVPCRHFKAGGCRFGNNCSFLHPGVNGPLL